MLNGKAIAKIYWGEEIVPSLLFSFFPSFSCPIFHFFSVSFRCEAAPLNPAKEFGECCIGSSTGVGQKFVFDVSFLESKKSDCCERFISVEQNRKIEANVFSLNFK